MRCEIIGNIASGKTTLVNLVSHPVKCVLEDFQQNPFWKSFYQAPELHSFETELTFTLQHYHQIKNNLRNGHTFICDFSLYLDRAYADVTLSPPRKKIYFDVLHELTREIGLPDVLIYIKCSENTLLERIKTRGRKNEKDITFSYLKAMTLSIEKNIKLLSQKSELVILNSEDSDILKSKKYARKIVDSIIKKLSK
ncbi:MAG: deoxynucleoside kinase [Pseudomonadota bacterium]